MSSWAEVTEAEEKQKASSDAAAAAAAAAAADKASSAAAIAASATASGAADNEADTTPDALAAQVAGLKAAPAVKPEDEDDPVKIPALQGGLQETETKLSVVGDRDDPNSPLYSVKSFEDLGLSQELLDGIYEMGFNKPSRIQEHALPIVLHGKKNLIAQAQSGTGKTAAFTLSMLSIADPELKAPQAICVCPTRELARQNFEVCKKMMKYTKFFPPLLIVPDAKVPKQIENQIIIGTPGKLHDFISSKRTLKTDKMRVFVLDEADVMIDTQGQLSQTKKIKSKMPPSCLHLLFSATYSDPVAAFAESFVPPPLSQIKLERDQLSLKKLKQFYINCGSEEHKFAVLEDIYAYMNVGQSIIFVHTKAMARSLKARMEAEGHTISMLTGDLTPAERDKVIDEFRSHTTRVLLSTNVMARGIDILQVNLVINYSPPLTRDNKPDAETYLHRVGRSARFGHGGLAVNFVYDELSHMAVKHFEKVYSIQIHEMKQEIIEQIGDMLKQLD